MSELTLQDWQELYKLAEIYYRRNRYHSEITKDDFSQLCAARVLIALPKLPEFRSVYGFLSSVVYFTALSYSLSENNVKRSRSKLWSKQRHELPMGIVMPVQSTDEGSYQYEFMPESSSQGYEDVEAKINCEDVLKYAKKHLSPLENDILYAIYSNKTYLHIAKEHNMSEKSVYTTWNTIKRKLKVLK